jgi:hypothetical protein
VINADHYVFADGADAEATWRGTDAWNFNVADQTDADVSTMAYSLARSIPSPRTAPSPAPSAAPPAGNPMAYLDAELGAVARSVAALDSFVVGPLPPHAA